MTTLALNKQFKPTLSQALVLFKQVDARKTSTASAPSDTSTAVPKSTVSKTIA